LFSRCSRRGGSAPAPTGRFTQEDPIGLAGGFAQFGFAAGDPVNFSDPFGLKVCFNRTHPQYRRHVRETERQYDVKITEVGYDGCVESWTPNRNGRADRHAEFAERNEATERFVPVVWRGTLEWTFQSSGDKCKDEHTDADLAFIALNLAGYGTVAAVWGGPVAWILGGASLTVSSISMYRAARVLDKCQQRSTVW
jgi:hypothetical protein